MAKDLTEALHQLTVAAAGQTSREDRTLPAGRVPPAIPERIGASGPITSASGGAIASPLVEQDYAERTFHGETNIMSTDGLIVLKIKPVKTIKFKDANLAPVTIEFKAPA